MQCRRVLTLDSWQQRAHHEFMVRAHKSGDGRSIEVADFEVGMTLRNGLEALSGSQVFVLLVSIELRWCRHENTD